MSNIETQCLNCNKTFYPRKEDVKRGRGKYCCIPCCAEFRAKNRPEKSPNTECFLCKKPIWRKNLSKSKSGKHFCCNQHKNIATELDRNNKDLWSYKDANGRGSYRKKVLRNKPIKSCEMCGYSEHPGVLQVHHKDCDRGNNSLDNLQILCPNCHDEFHYLTRTGRFSRTRDDSATE